MSQDSTNSLIKQIIDNIDIVDEVSKDVVLTKKGNNFVGLCPFHDDTNPSFTVSPTKKICHCFVCKAGGNVITYRQQYNKISFNEALSLLAKEIGIDIKPKVSKPKNPIICVNEDVTRFYHQTLMLTKQGKLAREYLQRRGIDQRIIERHQLGYSAPDLSLYDYLVDTSNNEHYYQLHDIETSDVVRGDKHFEFFNKRLVIPIFDQYHRPVGFSGRIINDSDQAKYMNSAQTQVFNKKEILYNLDLAKDNLVDHQLILVEGFFDVFSFELQGIYNVVASMGTAITNNHINLLKKYQVEQLILSLDQDQAGIDATLDVIDQLLVNNFNNVRVIVFDQYKDIDEYVQAGLDVNTLINSAIDVHEFKINHLAVNSDDLQSVKQYCQNILGFIDPTSGDYDFYVLKIAKKLKLDSEIVKNLKIKYMIPKPTPVVYESSKDEQESNYQSPTVLLKSTGKPTHSSYVDDQTILLNVCLTRKGFIWVEQQTDLKTIITDDNYKTIYEQICKMYQVNANLEQISISQLSDLSSSDNYYLLEQIYRVKYDPHKVKAIVEQNEKQRNCFNWMKGSK